MIYGDNKSDESEQSDDYPNITSIDFSYNPLDSVVEVKTETRTPDILAIIQSGNLYMYCGNNPIMYEDPSGEFWWWIPQVIPVIQRWLYDYPAKGRPGFVKMVWEQLKSIYTIEDYENYTDGYWGRQCRQLSHL
jgi:hypothetical protein